MSSKLASDAILAYEAAIARIILVTVIESTPCLGRPPSRGFVASALTGSLRENVISVDAHRLPTFGVLARLGRDTVFRFLGRLVEAGLLDRVRDRNGVVVSAYGRALLEGAGVASPPLGLLEGAVDSTRLDLAVRSGLVDALRRFRSEQAQREDVPEYRLFPEATLRELAAALPRTRAELGAIPGFGPKRIDLWGEKLLGIVAEHAPIVERLAADRAEPGDEVDIPLGPAPASA